MIRPSKLCPEIKIDEVVKDLEVLVTSRWEYVKDNEALSHNFASRLRNYFFDLPKTLCNLRLRSLASEGLSKELLTWDHIFPRTLCAKYIVYQFATNKNLTFEDKKHMVIICGGFVTITKEEHKIVTKYCKENYGLKNYEVYSILGIDIPSLDEHVEKNKHILSYVNEI